MNHQYNVEKFWIGINIRLATLNKKRIWLSEVTPIQNSTINNWYKFKRWPSALEVYYLAKALNTTVEELIKDSIKS